MNLADLLYVTAARHPGRPALTDVRTSRCLTYGELARESERVAAFLIAQGVEPGQRIGLMAPNGAAHVAAAFGLLAAGACLVPVAPHLTPPEMAAVFDEVDVNGCLSWPDAAPWPRGSDKAVLSGGAADGFVFEWLDRGAEPPAELARLHPAFIRFTSGTTDRCKGVVLSHEGTAARVEAADAVLDFQEHDRVVWVLPLAYHFAVTVVTYVRAGAHILMCPDTLPSALLHAIRLHRATVFYASPLHFERMSRHPAGAPLSSLRLALSTSAPIAPETMDRFHSAHGVPVSQAYGVIEAGLPCINLAGDGLPPVSVGRPVPGYGVAVLSEAGAPVAAGESGEIGVRGPGLFSAYYTPWTPRDQVTRQGWFPTGDIGRLDEDGALYLLGRKKAVIFVAGLKFFPDEVEACIDRFPGVRESRVWGESHPHLGQVPRAEIVVEPGGCDLDLLRAHCARTLSPYKVPVDFAVVTALARSPGGKLLRRAAP
jgi:long-chain acyl-CoA synthetase